MFNQHTDDAIEEEEDEASKDVEVEVSENIQSVTNLSNTFTPDY